jgi:putative hydrolase of the HAD superfamily
MVIDWGSVEFVVFDVDGTLYNQANLRIQMTRMLFRHSILTRSSSTFQILRSYRRWREELADKGTPRFEEVLLQRLASRYHKPEDEINRLVSDWMEVRPLPFLKQYRYPGVKELFAQLRSTGKTIGILSDYPAQNKLSRLELEADFIVSARDQEVGVLKPNPRGLHYLMELARVSPIATVMIGDRAERDGEMGHRAGVRTYLRSTTPIHDWEYFNSFYDII